MRRFIVILLVMLAVGVAEGATQRWETVDIPPRVLVENQHTGDEIEGVTVAVSEGYIYVAAEAPVDVRVFTILGQLISQEKLEAGTHRFHMKSRGIYILKIGSQTRRVTI